jgi:hypothetical protein
MELNDFKTDRDIENAGVWKPCGNGRILITSNSSESFRKAMKKIFGPREIELTLGTLPDEEANNLMMQAEAEGLVLNWENMTEDGKIIDYTPETCVRIFKAAPRFRQFVQRESNNIENFRAKKESIESKN